MVFSFFLNFSDLPHLVLTVSYAIAKRQRGISGRDLGVE